MDFEHFGWTSTWSTNTYFKTCIIEEEKNLELFFSLSLGTWSFKDSEHSIPANFGGTSHWESFQYLFIIIFIMDVFIRYKCQGLRWISSSCC